MTGVRWALAIDPRLAPQLARLLEVGARVLTERDGIRIHPDLLDVISTLRSAAPDQACSSGPAGPASGMLRAGSVHQAALALGVSDSRVRTLCRKGQLQAVRRGDGWVIDADSAMRRKAG